MDLTPKGGELIRADVELYEEDELEHLKDALVEGELNRESLASGNRIILNSPLDADDWGLNVGDTVTLSIYDGEEKVEKDFIIDAITHTHGAVFKLPTHVASKFMKTDVATSLDITVDSSAIKTIEPILQEIADENIFIKLQTLSNEIVLYEGVLSVIKTLAYALVMIIGSIGLMNLINTMMTSIMARKKELGMLQAIGLTNKQLVRMLQMEGLFYTGGTLFITLTLGNIMGYVAFSAFKNSGASYAQYSYPLIPTLIMIVVLTLSQLVISYFVSAHFSKQSLVDRIRYSD